MSHGPSPSWTQVRTDLVQRLPQLYELEPGGALALDLDSDGWMLEITPDGRLLCQHGVAIDDVKSLISDGTPEDLGTDEVAKQAKYFLQPAVAKFRSVLVKAGFEEGTAMNDEYVAITFEKTFDADRLDDLSSLIRWCQQHIT